MKRMKKVAPLILCVFMILMGYSSAEGVMAPLKMRLSTRSGPSTKYDEPGTFFQNDWRNTRVLVLSKSWDSSNDIWWVQVEFTTRGGTPYRAWTGLKRVDIDIGRVPEFQSVQWYGWTNHAMTGYYGPGSHYARFGTVPEDYDFTVLTFEGDYVEIVYPEHGGRGMHRCWVYNDGSLNLNPEGSGPVGEY